MGGYAKLVDIKEGVEYRYSERITAPTTARAGASHYRPRVPALIPTIEKSAGASALTDNGTGGFPAVSHTTI